MQIFAADRIFILTRSNAIY